MMHQTKKYYPMDRTKKILEMVKDRSTINTLSVPLYEYKRTEPNERETFLQWFYSNKSEMDTNPSTYSDINCHISQILSSTPRGASSSKVRDNPQITENSSCQVCSVSSSTSMRNYPQRKYNVKSAKRILAFENGVDEFSNTSAASMRVESTIIESDRESYVESDEEYIPSDIEISDNSECSSKKGSSQSSSNSSNVADEQVEEKRRVFIWKTKSKAKAIKSIHTKEKSNCNKILSLDCQNNGLSDNDCELVANNENKQVAEISFQQFQRNKNGRIIRNKFHCCHFCNKLLSNNMARHFETVHNNELEVAKVLANLKNSVGRKKGFEELIRIGDFYYNCNVLVTRAGELILVRRPSELSEFTYADFGPCPNCLGFMLKRLLWHHMKYSCKSSKLSNANKPMAESAILLQKIIGNTNSVDFIEKVISTFKSDDVSNVCKEDLLITELGAFMFDKYGASQVEYIRQSMRQLARLKIKISKLDRTIKTMRQAIIPDKFDLIINATKRLCQVNYSNTYKRNQFGIPSLALKIGYHLRKCIAIERSNALKFSNINRDKTLQSLATLMDIEWSVKVSSNALNTLYKQKINCKQLLPVTSDLLKLNAFLKNNLDKLKVEIKHCNRQIWADLASSTICRIILFNKRRCGETSKMMLEQYSTRPSWVDEGTNELKNSLTPIERQLANRLTVVEIIGKRGRKVPVILDNEMKECVDILIKYRDKGEVSSTNPYIFARSKASMDGYLRGHDCLRKACISAGIPSENITSTKLRKYIATVCQIFNLKEHEQEWLARHLGHDYCVHRDFYRLHENSIELTKISRILLAVDNGQAEKFSGKELADINIEDLPEMEVEVDDVDEPNEDSTEEEERQQEYLKNTNKKVCHDVKYHKSIQNKRNSKQVWTQEQKQILFKKFRTFIKTNTLPGKAACEKCLEENELIFSNRKWTDVKYYIKNHLTKINKLKCT